MMIQMQEAVLQGKLLIPFYEAVAQKCGLALEDITYDCTKIEIAHNIQDALYAAYRTTYPAEYAQRPNDFDCEVTMLLARSGPKMDTTLPRGQVRIEAGFFRDGDGNHLPEQKYKENLNEHC